ncbi:hydrolase 1, exosortase A system-associated [Thauera propionica]|uniref:hydrolase 1, exosortase A system-associated n=1 Tax=Thauera propionica TaxID=2019431 RepID=UPI0023F0470D|nr:hydrolase 1, exosortase A system-associated [Thauera propionica]MDD3674125.1 hydrolase 1, exosortase A system-associated [Thauera propionica]
MEVVERAVMFDCRGESLIGIVSTNDKPASTGVLVIVGGPQYRVGSHRQFVRLARHLAREGVPCMRFDYRGMGDASGEQRSFATVNDDVCVAVDAFFNTVPALERVVLWGLCDGASAACMALSANAKVAGAVLLNPWVRTGASSAGVVLKHYYLRRFLDGRFWRKLLRGEVRVLRSVTSLVATVLGRARNEGASGAPGVSARAVSVQSKPAHLADVPRLPQRMLAGLIQSSVPVAVALSGRDLVAREFEELVRTDVAWRALLGATQVSLKHFEGADHTFSRAADAEAVERFTVEWLRDRGLLTEVDAA